MKLTLAPSNPVHGEARVPGDKSITHRALLLAALANGDSRISGYLDGGDCQATIGCLQQLGVRIAQPHRAELRVHGVGLRGLAEPIGVLNCIRSGTSMRLLSGILAGQSFFSVLSGDPQLLKRPMGRVVQPLVAMGAQIWGRDGDNLAPLAIRGTQLGGIEHRLPVASAQVKSALLLAGLYAAGDTYVIEPGPSRDHTERMLRARGVSLHSAHLTHRLCGPVEGLESLDVAVPGDFSSAAFLIGAALLIPASDLVVRQVNLNETRTGLLDALALMGAQIEVLDRHDAAGEPVGDLRIISQPLRAAEVGGALVPRMIDEFPLLALLATQAQGTTIVRDAGELRVKETDRIATVVSALRALGATIEGTEDGFAIHGPTPLVGAPVDSYGDHRLAMTLAVAALIATGETIIDRAECIDDSFPGFVPLLRRLVGCAS